MHSIDTPPVSPLERRGVIEIDTFCTGCFYNLHGQVVTIDERLGFPICRCPECGKYHPAGTGVTAAGVWVRRFASILLFAWVSIVIGSLLGIGGLMAALDGSSIGPYVYGYMTTLSGQPVTNSPTSTGMPAYILQGTNIAVTQTQTMYTYALYPWNTNSNTEPGPGFTAMCLMSAASLLLGLIAGTLCVTLLWHWPKRRYLWALIVVILPAALVTIPFSTSVEYMNIRAQCYERICCQAGFQCTGVLLGVLFGRAVSRGIIRSIIPPKPRQALAFLWLVDGKTPPAA